MTPYNQFKFSLRYFFESFSILKRAGLNYIYLVPLVFYLLFFALGFTLTNGIHAELMSWIREQSQEAASDNEVMESILTLTSVVTWIVIKIFLFIVIGALSGYLILIILAPLLTWVSEKVFVSRGGVAPPFSLERFLNDLKRALYIAVRNGLIQVALLLIFFFLGFIPGVNLLAAPCLFLISAYYYGFSFLDYSNERAGFSVKQSVLEVRRMKWAAVTLGSIFLFFTTIPYIGQVIASLLVFHLITAATVITMKNEEL